ncbi:Dehydrogenase [Pseudoalteromonas issachenkonii]|uniref:Gyoxylate/hydroxypyruvate reductase A n=1 Tax=Pseudoalteromonas issachenkonii TaxID=152297 RepID=A0ABM6N1T7_9GAMM|nr:glyoxylate/hydroxypyruvate reductase A [Pseudoalteromonas issachenkonii]ALQ54272.1 Dehydrogenase [Pseudoalteromonas issachenkonii]ATC90062.1 gyoxylate/hydroxypyruvate reductase A [Pseudoalteromonas issachenkonii]
MSVLVAITGRDNTKLIAKMKSRLPSIRIEELNDCQNLESVEFVLAWNAPASLWPTLPNLKAVSSFGAGVDSIDLSLLPADVEVVRIVDKQLANDMAEYVLTHVLAQKLRLKEYAIKQQQSIWKPKRAHKHNQVSILGFGELGQACAQRLVNNGFNVNAWSRSPKTSNIATLYHGDDGLTQMLAQTDYLVCLLPLTSSTQGIINKQLLEQLPEHAVVINVARGGHIVEADLLDALNNTRIRAATLDVFASEPLPSEHPYWLHPGITLTPHCAALSDLDSVIEQIAENILRLKAKQPLINCIDKQQGY